MNIENMSAKERQEELNRLVEATKAAKTAVKNSKAEVAACKAAVKAAKTPAEKAPCEAALKTAEQAQLAATANVAEATAQEAEFREAVKAAEAAETQARKADPFKALAEKYAKAYPECRAFHITTDKQVFLDKDKALAKFHQKGLGEGEVRTINVR